MDRLLELVDALVESVLRGLTAALPRLPEDDRDPRDVLKSP